jgi:hypothetical protein
VALVIAVAVVSAGDRPSRGSSPPATEAGATTSTTAPAARPTVPVTVADPGAAALRQLAGALSAGDGTAAPELAAGLDRVADLAPGARPASATTLLAQAADWYRSQELSAPAYEEAASTLMGVGAVVAGPPPAHRSDGAKGVHQGQMTEAGSRGRR